MMREPTLRARQKRLDMLPVTGEVLRGSLLERVVRHTKDCPKCKLRLLEIGRVARAKGPINQEKLKRCYRRLLSSTSRVVGQAKRFSTEIADGVKRSGDVMVAGHVRSISFSHKTFCR
jgi:hypothetical protein